MPQRLYASGEITGRGTCLDIALSSEGKMVGTVLLASGEVAAGVNVCLRGTARKAIRTATDATGQFSVGPIHGGAYAVEIGGHVFVVRAWQAGTAPPVAQTGGTFVLKDIVRGQLPGSDFFQSDRFLLAATITAAIVIPVAVYANRHDGQPGS